MKNSIENAGFLCPECGSREAETTPGSNEATGKRRGFFCLHCHFEIPAHLAQRWGRVSVEEARHEWTEVYRDLAQAREPT